MLKYCTSIMYKFKHIVRIITYDHINMYPYTYIYIYNVLISEMYLSIYGLLTHIQKKTLSPFRGATSHSRQIPPSDGTNGCGDGHQDRQGHITTSQQSEKIRSRSWKWSTNCRLLDRFQIHAKFTNHMFCWRFCCSVMCLLWKPSNGDTMLVFRVI